MLCKNCNEEIILNYYKSPSNMKKRVFCNRKCATEYKIGKKPSEEIRRSISAGVKFAYKHGANIGRKGQKRNFTEQHKKNISISAKKRIMLVAGWNKNMTFIERQGPNSKMWKGDKAGYAAFHKRIGTIRGKPKICEVCNNDAEKRYEWANLTGKYEDINDYKRMCTKCHRRYDNERKNKKN